MEYKINSPTVQSETFADANIIVAKVDDLNNLAFRHVVAFVEFVYEKVGVAIF